MYHTKNIITRTGKPGYRADIVPALFMLLFTYTAINKFIAVNDLQLVFKDYPLIGDFWAPVFSWALPVAESIVVIWLFIPATKLLGLYASMFMLIIFTGYISYMLLFTGKQGCTCGGLLEAMNWWQHIIFNVVAIGVLVIGIRLYKKKEYK